MSRHRVKKLVLIGMLTMPMFQLGGCIGDLLIRLAGVAFLDVFVGPLVGDECSIINQAACNDENPS